jgi:hypothetical protein
MAFSTGTATDITALITALNTFAVANGWTSDLLPSVTPGQMAMHRNNIYVSFRWATSSPTHLGVYQALGYTGGNQPGQHPNDSNNGAVTGTDATLLTERCVSSLGNGPFTYWFFEQDVYIHVVVEATADVFKHFGMGTLVKTGDWTGGEYAYGHYDVSATSARITTNTFLLDGIYNETNATSKMRAATLHVEGLPAQGGTGKWGQVTGSSVAPGNDTAGVLRVSIHGGFRGGPTATPFGRFAAGLASGEIPMYPIEVYYWDITNARAYYLGYMPDVRGVNIKNFAARQVVTIGSDQWYFFPSAQKVTGVTQNQGIAYRRDDA